MIQRHFVLIAIILSILALVHPEAFSWGKVYIPYLLGIIMFGMGLTLQGKDFLTVWDSRKAVVVGVLSQYTIMPLLAIILSKILNLPDAIVVGMVLVGACPGGTASNVVTYLARGNVAFSVTMTVCSTLLAPLMTPFIVYIFARQIINVPFWSMVESILWIVFIPLLLGLILRKLFPESSERLTGVLPSLSILTISFVIAVIMALNRSTVLSFPLLIMLAVIIHNLLGMLLGYGIGSLFKLDKEDRRTLSIEVGMQNSGLGASLATSFFTAQSALPSALFSLWHNISGVSIAKYWSRR